MPLRALVVEKGFSPNPTLHSTSSLRTKLVLSEVLTFAASSFVGFIVYLTPNLDASAARRQDY